MHAVAPRNARAVSTARDAMLGAAQPAQHLEAVHAGQSDVEG